MRERDFKRKGTRYGGFILLNAVDISAESINFGVYYTEGSDLYWLSRTEECFRKKLRQGSLSLHVFDRVNALSEILDALGVISFFGESNVVIIKDSEYKFTDREHKLLSGLSLEDGYLLFVGNKNLTSSEKKAFTGINCAKLDKFACVKYASELFPSGIDRDAANILVEYSDCDMARIKLEAEKLDAYCDGKKVTAKDVKELVSEETDLQIFSFVSALTEGKKELAAARLAFLKQRGESPAYLLSALTGQYARMLYAALSPKSDADLASVMGIKEFAVKKARSTRVLSKVQLKKTVNMLVDYELKFKSGLLTDRTALDAAVARLFAGEVK